MDETNVSDDSRRTVLKGAAATGLAATGLGLFGSSATAQQDIRELSVDLSEQDGLLNVNIQNVNVLRNVNVQDIVVTVIDGDVLSDINVNVEDVNVEILTLENVDILNDSTVQVAVAALSDTGDIVAAGSDALN